MSEGKFSQEEYERLNGSFKLGAVAGFIASAKAFIYMIVHFVDEVSRTRVIYSAVDFALLLIMSALLFSFKSMRLLVLLLIYYITSYFTIAARYSEAYDGIFALLVCYFMLQAVYSGHRLRIMEKFNINN
ncbi:MAG: hypothetical protein ACLFQK_07130 [Fibrobacterota bacterium]